MLKWVIGALLVLAVTAILFVRSVWMATFGPGSTAKETARILVHDLKFGGRAKHKAVEYGDRFLPLLGAESENFSRLNGRNSFWIADVLGAIRTDKSRAILLDLYSRTNSIAKLTGAVGLTQQSLLPVEIDQNCFLVQTVRNAPSQTETQLAIIALGWSKNPAALPCLLDLLQQRGVDYWYHAYACAAVARIGLKNGTPILRECLRSPEFHALPEAFRALICLGDSEAVPLAIARVSPDIKGYNSGFVVGELKKVTGKSYGYDQNSWRNWWRSTKGAWQIPEEFRKSWDEQKGLD
ncbi:MAG: HEAT repeat domain-containing protein [Verrucomicrobia bacterium]|nr:HEAT repeat domain-containing protein [Verrucomicrobiota bacterium]